MTTRPTRRAVVSSGLALMTATATSTSSQGSDVGSAPVVWIAVEKTETGIALSGQLLAIAPFRGKATLSVDRDGTSGRMKTAQGSPFDLAAGENASVSRLGLSFDAGDRLNASLIAEGEGGAVSTATIAIGPDSTDL